MRLIGRKLAHYEIVAKLGEGGMGEVYLAEDDRLQRKVALKVLSRELASDSDRLRRLQREARSLAALDHPNIVPVYSFESADGVYFLTMAFIEGQPLEEQIPVAGFTIEELLDLAVPLADALRAAHQQGIIHRDLKPANVMRDREGRPRILDFGLAKRGEVVSGQFGDRITLDLSGRMTQEGTILGTFPYMSPEQAEGKSVDARSDLFSFGVMLYEMACGRRPFQGDTAVSLISSILREHQRPVWELKPGLPAALDRILARCLQKDPADRYSTAEALRDELAALRRQVLRGEALPAVSDGPTILDGAKALGAPQPRRDTAARPPGRRALPLVTAVAAVAVAALVVATWKLWPRAGPTRSLAVLSFVNADNDPESDYLCEGIADSLIRRIAGLRSVEVRPLSAVLNLKGTDVDPREAGRKLGVENVLAGTLGLDDDLLRITAELVNVESGRTLWSNRYDRKAVELLGVQEEIAAAMLNTGLRLELGGDQKAELVRRPTTDGEAYDLYLQARYLQRRATEDDYLEARELLQRAIVRDSRYAQAYLALAGIHSAMAIDGYVRPTDGWAQANRFLRQALAIDPDLPDAQAIRHGLSFFFDWDWEGSERERRLAVQSQAGEFDPDLHRVYSFFLVALGRTEEALEMARRARELDPLSVGLAMLEADYLVRLGQYDSAIASYNRAIQVEPDNPEQYFGLAEAYAQQGKWAEAIEARRRAHEVAGDAEMAALFAATRGEKGFREADREWVRLQLLALEVRSAWGYVSPLDFARVYAQLGEVDGTFKHLEEAFEHRSPGLVFLNSDPAWDRVREDPRFLNAVRRVGLPTPQG